MTEIGDEKESYIILSRGEWKKKKKNAFCDEIL